MSTNIHDQIKVMQHYAHGGKIEHRYRRKDGGTEPWKRSEPNDSWQFNWLQAEYRIAQPKIAEGHNPDELTEEQVGVKYGWRLLSPEEVDYRAKSNPLPTNEINVWNTEEGETRHEWILVAVDPFGYHRASTYRTKRPPGFFLPKTKKQVPLEASDIPAVCWVRHSGVQECCNLLTFLSKECVQLGGCAKLTYQSLASGYEYSSDRINWKPCHKEIEA